MALKMLSTDKNAQIDIYYLFVIILMVITMVYFVKIHPDFFTDVKYFFQDIIVQIKNLWS